MPSKIFKRPDFGEVSCCATCAHSLACMAGRTATIFIYFEPEKDLGDYFPCIQDGKVKVQPIDIGDTSIDWKYQEQSMGNFAFTETMIEVFKLMKD